MQKTIDDVHIEFKERNNTGFGLPKRCRLEKICMFNSRVARAN